MPDRADASTWATNEAARRGFVGPPGAFTGEIVEVGPIRRRLDRYDWRGAGLIVLPYLMLAVIAIGAIVLAWILVPTP